MPYPSPEAEDPSKYGDQFLDRPHHLDTSIDMISIICREKVTQSVAASASASPSPLVLEAWPWSPQWRWWSWWRLSYASVSHWPILLLLSHWSNSIWLLLSHWSKPICLSSHETVMVSRLSLIASLFCTRLLPTPAIDTIANTWTIILINPMFG